MNLDSENLTLKPLSFDELDTNYINWLNDADTCKYNSHGDAVYTRKMAEEFIKNTQKSKNCEVWAVYLKSHNHHIGNISLQNIDFKNRQAEIAYLFGEKQYWGRGYATEASKILIKRAFEDLKLHRLYFGTHIDNIAMQKVGEKLGFQKEGLLKDAQYKNGKYNDIVCYGLIQQERGGLICQLYKFLNIVKTQAHYFKHISKNCRQDFIWQQFLCT